MDWTEVGVRYTWHVDRGGRYTAATQLQEAGWTQAMGPSTPCARSPSLNAQWEAILPRETPAD
eukprot:2296486-Prymnesium_polylepis.1